MVKKSEFAYSADKARKWLADNNLPYSDAIPLRPSNLSFPKGGQYGVEIPVINNLKTVEATIKALKREGVYCTRFDETHGSFLLSDQEITEMLKACLESNIGLLIGIGPRPEYDIKASFYRTPFGLEQGRQLNNNDAISYAIEEAFRLADLGCRGITVYDVGVLKILQQLRNKNLLPKSMIFKTSPHCMATNPMLAQIFSENGADSITTTHDLGLPVIQEMRRLNPTLVLDVPTDVYKSKGGFIRFYEIAEIVQIAAPVILKSGASAQAHPYDQVKDETAIERVRRVGLVLEYLHKYFPQAAKLTNDDPFCCLPEF